LLQAVVAVVVTMAVAVAVAVIAQLLACLYLQALHTQLLLVLAALLQLVITPTPVGAKMVVLLVFLVSHPQEVVEEEPEQTAQATENTAVRAVLVVEVPEIQAKVDQVQLDKVTEAVTVLMPEPTPEVVEAVELVQLEILAHNLLEGLVLLGLITVHTQAVAAEDRKDSLEVLVAVAAEAEELTGTNTAQQEPQIQEVEAVVLPNQKLGHTAEPEAPASLSFGMQVLLNEVPVVLLMLAKMATFIMCLTQAEHLQHDKNFSNCS
jgi:hypothetical protein